MFHLCIFRVNVDFGSTCAPRFQQGPRFGDNEEESVEVNRVLERCLKESRLVILLCKAEEYLTKGMEG